MLYDDNIVNNNSAEKLEEYAQTFDRNLLIEILTNAYKSCESMIMPEVKKGRFINLDETKLEAIMDMLDDPVFRKNLKLGKFAK